jgi:hypothetical protein
MDAQALLPVDTDTLLALVAHLRETGSELSLAEAAALAVRAWLAASPLAVSPLAVSAPAANAPAASNRSANVLSLNAHPVETSANDALAVGRSADKKLADSAFAEDALAEPAHTAMARGYQWKELFLPDGTDVRMRCDGDVHHARVKGDSIVYQSHRVSPRQFTLVVAGDGRNAWRDLSLRLPGEKGFQPASLLRHRARVAIKSAGKPAPESPSATIAAAAASMSEALRTALQLVEHSNAQSLPKFERRVESHRRAADVFTDHTTFD